MDKIEKIRQEIERRKNMALDDFKKGLITIEALAARRSQLDGLSLFLDTLSEEPMQKFNTNKLQEIAKPATPHKKPTPEDRAKFMEELHEYAESKKPDKSLEEAAIGNYYGGGYVPKNQELREIALKTKEVQSFIAGAEWQEEQDLKYISEIHRNGYNLCKEQMMKDAVEGYVNYYEDSGGILMAEAQVGCPYHNGDKVRILVLKEEK